MPEAYLISSSNRVVVHFSGSSRVTHFFMWLGLSAFQRYWGPKEMRYWNIGQMQLCLSSMGVSGCTHSTSFPHMSEMVLPWHEWSPWALHTYIALGTANHPLRAQRENSRGHAWITAGFHKRYSCSWQPSQHVVAFRGGDRHPSYPLVLPENGQYLWYLAR